MSANDQTDILACVETLLTFHNLPIQLEWQLTAASRMVHLAQSPYRGGILGDSMGMGKTLGIIIAMMEGKENRSGYHIVVTTKGATRQSIDELEKNIAPCTFSPCF